MNHRHGNRRARYLSALVVFLFVPLLFSSPAKGAKADGGAAEEWQEAAFNYEYAAEAQETAADMMLNQARIFRAEASEDQAKSRRGRIQAGNLDVRAGDLLVAASGNLDHAARTWRQAALSSGRDSASYSHYVTASETAAARASTLLRRAVDLYERAAATFSEGDEMLSQAAANQKAAGLRERLAVRR